MRTKRIERGLRRGTADGRRRWRGPAWVAGALALAAVAATTFFLIGDGGDSAPRRALTPDEANRLAITRFLNYQAGGRAVTITVPSTAGGLVITGSVDYRAGIGYGVVRGAGRDTSGDGLIQWTAAAVLVHPMADAPATAPPSPPASGWYRRPLQKSGSSLDSSLAIALGLGSDRPDNAELLPQNGAETVGQDTVRGHSVEVMTGPNAHAKLGTSGAAATSNTGDSVRYWIGADGTMYRVRASVASESQPVVIDFDDRKYVPVRPAPGVTPAG
ncbi:MULTISPECIES: hypothetical protein [unclassified Streptomyces]|uniref:hypothetical protein n=1 Tax=unclassified Streptomyces TaxID=2593676 RepID=UPI001F458C17|nr:MULTISPECIES: hypothetical protein [unclassified Streptomyces]WKE69158.1 hypothetical protein QHG49_09020 [Streptomyces sp. WP-1]